ncbi:MAG: histidinol dehydrogenase [Firmicutes bacterium]|nr:histidinol dehydrogenase [Bacillota bacterium]
MKYIKEGKERKTTINKEVRNAVSSMIDDVIERGDEAVIEYSEKFDGSTRRAQGMGLRVGPEEIAAAYEEVGKELLKDMAQAAMNILAFAEAQKMSLQEVHDFSPREGVFLGHRIIPIDSCMCYVPGGNYPLYSTALMLIIPAKEAGVKRVIACSPVEKGSGRINAKTLVAMDIAGVDEIYAVGGTQAIAAGAYGTESIKAVDLIVGPGNQYVAEAKRQCYGQVGIDFVAGPSEVLIISDGTGDPEVVAADLLAQAEHDVNAKSVLIVVDEEMSQGSTKGSDFAESVIKAVHKELDDLPTREIAKVSWENNGEVMIASSYDEAINYANEMAPEHLELNTKEAKEEDIEKVGLSGEPLKEVSAMDIEYMIKNLTNYGSLFMGQNTAEVFGDYASGTNHTLPTVRASRYTGGLWVGTFLKTATYQYMTEKGSKEISPIVRRLAEGEGLMAHAISAKCRE